MEKIVISGGVPLIGEYSVQGAKNCALPLLAAAVLIKGKTVLHNCPDLTDVDAACKILSYLGCRISRSGTTVEIDASSIKRSDVPDDLMREMRSSIVFLGAIAARTHGAVMSFPGGCELGPRPIDLHLMGLRQLGLEIKEEYGELRCELHQKRFRGTRISFSFPSVGATENIMIAAATSLGQTVVSNAAQEPEIIALADFLNRCGAKIHGAGESTVVIDGVESLHSTEFQIIPDRIVAVTYLCAAAATNGELYLTHVISDQIGSVLPIFEEMGCDVKVYDGSIHLKSKEKLKAVQTVRTMPYPGFPTDAQAPVMVLAAIANGATLFVENVFENRYKHVSELSRMGANIKVEGKVALVRGVDSLYGSSVEATDLRGGAALVVAGLAASGVTTVGNVFHIDRGYENLEKNLAGLGGRIHRELES